MSALTHWNPFRSIQSQEDAFQDLVREFFGTSGSPDLMPPVEFAESDGEVTVKTAVPGVEKDRLSISVDDHVLNVRGESKKKTEEKKRELHLVAPTRSDRGADPLGPRPPTRRLPETL